MNATGTAIVAALAGLFLFPANAGAQWNGYASDPQHTAISTATVPSLALNGIRWTTPVDDSPPTGTIYRHYGAPLVTAQNTVIVPVRTSSGGYRIEAHSATAAAPNLPVWQLPTDYTNSTTPPQDGGWVPPFSPTLTPSGALYYPGAGGAIYRVDNPNSSTTPASVPVRFYTGYESNPSAYNNSVFISTPLTSDAAGNIYFGYETTASAPGGMKSGLARVASNGSATFISADAASGLGGSPGLRVATNCAPAISSDGTSLYVALRTDTGSSAYLAKLSTATLAFSARASLGADVMFDGSTAAPTIGPNGDVYFGTLGGYHYRGLLRHYSADLSQSFAPGSFGWDITPSIVPRSMVEPSYSGPDYYLMTKYNDYYGFAGGTGINKLAILDPNATQFDPLLGQNVMKEILTIAGVTPDPPGPGVREWCINTAAVDLLTKSILVNSEDGVLYRWNLPTNTFSESIALQATGTLEAYTPTAIGPDGTVYAINKAMLFAVGVPEPGSAVLLGLGWLVLSQRRRTYRGF
jgi:hypothetical protein